MKMQEVMKMYKWGWETYTKELWRLPWGRDVWAELGRRTRKKLKGGHPKHIHPGLRSPSMEKTSQVILLPSLVQVSSFLLDFLIVTWFLMWIYLQIEKSTCIINWHSDLYNSASLVSESGLPRGKASEYMKPSYFQPCKARAWTEMRSWRDPGVCHLPFEPLHMHRWFLCAVSRTATWWHTQVTSVQTKH